jgi:predicted NUDIX family NTP pyrophosphohydrolase
MPKTSAGIILYRKKEKIEFLLVHPGGPFFAKKDEGVWSIPKGENDNGDELLSVAKREFKEETGFDAPEGEYIPLGTVTQKNGKEVHAWGVEGEIDAENITSNTIMIDWPPRSGKQMEIPEVDKAGFFDLEAAKNKVNPAQIPLLERLLTFLENGV